MIRRPPRSTLDRSSAASDVYKRQVRVAGEGGSDRGAGGKGDNGDNGEATEAGRTRGVMPAP